MIVNPLIRLSIRGLVILFGRLNLSDHLRQTAWGEVGRRNAIVRSREWSGLASVSSYSTEESKS